MCIVSIYLKGHQLRQSWFSHILIVVVIQKKIIEIIEHHDWCSLNTSRSHILLTWLAKKKMNWNICHKCLCEMKLNSHSSMTAMSPGSTASRKIWKKKNFVTNIINVPHVTTCASFSLPFQMSSSRETAAGRQQGDILTDGTAPWSTCPGKRHLWWEDELRDRRPEWEKKHYYSFADVVGLERSRGRIKESHGYKM